MRQCVKDIVYKSIIHTSSHAPEIDSVKKESDLWKESYDSEEREGKWEGFKKEAVTYKNYLPLWKAIMMPEKVAYVKIPAVNKKGLILPAAPRAPPVHRSQLILCCRKNNIVLHFYPSRHPMGPTGPIQPVDPSLS
ncbi:hypothetical protein E2C01_023834 [Portunus trituberculatus]|uniref:Uncharacterized protein n=1 Tax=Portunus trituberculatus TaxID=210409 RepID=A0A5B7EB21_PORTR|nr:hypothetical protein [Portunus trituberculatus]